MVKPELITFVNVVGVIIAAVSSCALGFLLTALIDEWRTKKA